MKPILFAFALTGLLITAAPAATEARSYKFRGTIDQPLFARDMPRRAMTQRRRSVRRFRPARHLGRINRPARFRSTTRRRAQVRGFRQRDLDRLPISVTRPPNAGHYQYQGYPLWAARAFQPVHSR